MRKYQNKILIIVFIGILITGFGVWRVVEAADSSIYVSPAQADKKIGDTFDISVKVSSGGQKVCVVEGKLNLNKLSCQKITMGSGISAQISPSCDDLSFILGIQGCVTSEKTLFTVRVEAKNTGTGTAGFTGVDIIGEGVPISFISSGGTYTLTVLEEAAPESEEEIIPEEEEIIVEGETEEIEETEETEIIVDTAKQIGEEPPVSQPGEQEKQTSFLASVGNIISLGTNSITIGIIVLLVILGVVGYGIYELIWKKRIKRSK